MGGQLRSSYYDLDWLSCRLNHLIFPSPPKRKLCLPFPSTLIDVPPFLICLSITQPFKMEGVPFIPVKNNKISSKLFYKKNINQHIMKLISYTFKYFSRKKGGKGYLEILDLSPPKIDEVL